jgi:adenosylhomocysteine nucleosidase
MRRIDILFAVPQERGPLARLLPVLPGRESGYRHVSVLHRQAGAAHLRLAVGGMGQKQAARAARELLADDPPHLLVMAGVAGALDPALRIGDVIVAGMVYAGAETLIPDIPFDRTPEVRSGPLLTVDRVLISAGEKRTAYAETRPPAAPVPALAVEMETAAVARVAVELGIPWAAVRALSDTADETLPVDFNALRDTDGDLPTSRVALYALTHPGCIPGLMRLGRNTGFAAEALARFLHRWVTNPLASDNGPEVGQ